MRDSKAAPSALGLTAVTLEVQRKEVCACMTRDFKVGVSNLRTAESVYLARHPGSFTHSHSPQEKGFGDPLLLHLRPEWMDEAVPGSQLQGWDRGPRSTPIRAS